MMDIQIRDVKPFEQYCIDEFSMCHDDGDFERDVLGFYEHVETERLWRVWELQAAKAQVVPEGFVLVPKEPTPKMIDSTWDYDEEIYGMSSNERNRFIYKAMIEAQEQK